MILGHTPVRLVNMSLRECVPRTHRMMVCDFESRKMTYAGRSRPAVGLCFKTSCASAVCGVSAGVNGRCRKRTARSCCSELSNASFLAAQTGCAQRIALAVVTRTRHELVHQPPRQIAGSLWGVKVWRGTFCQEQHIVDASYCCC
jgi:hypothetical protein